MESVRITSLSLEYFRGIRKGKVEDLSQVNVFVGPNNSGKSSILFAVYLFSGLLGRGWKRFPSYTQYNVQDFGENVHTVIFNQDGNAVGMVPYEISRYFFYKYDASYPLQIQIEMDSGNYKFILRKEERAKSIRATPKSVSLFFSQTRMIFAIEDPQKPEEIFYEVLLQKNLDKVLYHLLQKVFHLPVEYLTYTPNQILLLKLTDRSIRFEDLGDGAKRTMRMLFTAAAAAKGALLLEEPENHQHPRSLQESIRALLTAAKDLDIQIFATTHSRECLVAFHEEAKRQGLEARFFYTRLHENDELEVISVTPEGLDAFEEMGLDLRYYGSQD